MNKAICTAVFFPELLLLYKILTYPRIELCCLRILCFSCVPFDVLRDDTTGSYCDASDDPGLSHQVHEGVLNPDQDVSGHPVTAALLYVGAWGMRVVTSGRGRPRCHRTVADWARTRTGLWRKQKFLKKHSHLSVVWQSLE